MRADTTARTAGSRPRSSCRSCSVSAETPRIGPRRVPVTFELLAPNGRPVQVTMDLTSFWRRGYQEVRRELRARYPKHPWPEDPVDRDADASDEQHRKNGALSHRMTSEVVACCHRRTPNVTDTPSASSSRAIGRFVSATKSVTGSRTGRFGSGCSSSPPGRSPSICSRTGRSRPMMLWLLAVLVGDRHRRLARAIARRRAGAVHPAVQRRPAQSALSARLLHVRLERGRELCRAEQRRAHRRDRQRHVADARHLRHVVSADRRHHVDPRAPPVCCRVSAVRPAARAPSGGTSTDRSGRCASRSRCCGSSGRCCRRRGLSDVIKLAVFWGVLAYVGNLSRRGLLPRTRPILPGETAVAD